MPELSFSMPVSMPVSTPVSMPLTSQPPAPRTAPWHTPTRAAACAPSGPGDCAVNRAVNRAASRAVACATSCAANCVTNRVASRASARAGAHTLIALALAVAWLAFGPSPAAAQTANRPDKANNAAKATPPAKPAAAKAATAPARTAAATNAPAANGPSAAPAKAASAADAADGARRFDQGLLWKVEFGTIAPNYIFGTLHVDDPGAKDFSPTLRKLVAGASLFLPEVKADEAANAAFGAAMQLPAGQSLSKLLPPQDMERVSARMVEAYGWQPELVDRMKPWAAYLVLSQPLTPPVEILDIALLRLATEAKRPVRPLETTQQQIDAMESVPQKHQLLLLSTLARLHDQSQARLPTMIDTYRRGDLVGLRKLEGEFAEGDAALREAFQSLTSQLVDKRNRQMVSSMLPALRQGNAVIAVGALHLTGEAGVLNILAKRGWKIQRLE